MAPPKKPAVATDDKRQSRRRSGSDRPLDCDIEAHPRVHLDHQAGVRHERVRRGAVARTPSPSAWARTQSRRHPDVVVAVDDLPALAVSPRAAGDVVAVSLAGAGTT